MNLVARQIYGNKKGGANLIIGGLGGVSINTKSDLVSKFSFSESDISKFDIVGNDVRATITKDSYYILIYAFRNNTSITSIKETSGFLKDGDGFGFQPSVFEGATSLVSAEFAGVLSLGATTFSGCSSLSPSNLKLPNAIANRAFPGMFNSLKNDGTTLNLKSIKSINLYPVASNTAFQGSSLNTIDLSELLILSVKASSGTNGMFALNHSSILLWKLQTLGNTPDEITYIFNGFLSTVKKIYINIAMKTINAGNPHADLTWAIGKGATVYYTDNNGNVI